MKRLLCAWAAAAALACCTPGVYLQGQAGTDETHRTTHAGTAEARTGQRLESLRSDPPGLHAFLEGMPLGADLHMHLSGAVYAETFLSDAAEDHLCVDTQRLAFATRAVHAASAQADCGPGTVPVSQAIADQKLYDALIDSFSMRGFVPTPGWDGHDQFFATFGRFGGTSKSHLGEWVDEVATRAAEDNEQYLEVMTTPEFSHAIALSHRVHWNGDPASMHDALLRLGLFEEVEADRAEIASMNEMRTAREHCGTRQATAGCSVQVRYIYQVLRANPPEQVFAQLLLGFEVASKDANVVGINLVQPEDARVALEDYSAQMAMLHYLHGLYPKVHISLHAGELTEGLVRPRDLRFHIRQAVDVAGAERIGHGVDVMYETQPLDLLHEMAAKHILVEVNLTSNDVILGVRGRNHPLHDYIAAGVPFALSTDDEGVSRIDLAHEYARAVLEQGLTYEQLKQSARASLEHSFLPGASLWNAADNYTRMRDVCVSSHGDRPTDGCAAFLKTSEKAAQQFELERRFRVFETKQAALPIPRRVTTPVQEEGHP